MMKVHHIGYLVKKLNKSLKQFSDLGFNTVSEVTHDDYRGIDIVFMEKDGYLIELVSPFSTDSDVAELMRTYKNTPYHICYETYQFEEDISRFEHQGFMLFKKPSPAPALENRRVCFMISANIGIIELLERIH